MLTLGAVGMYIYARLLAVSRTTSMEVALRMREFVGVHNEYTYMRVHEKYACGTETQLPASRKQ